MVKLLPRLQAPAASRISGRLSRISRGRLPGKRAIQVFVGSRLLLRQIPRANGSCGRSAKRVAHKLGLYAALR